jgi:hypothetical protein
MDNQWETVVLRKKKPSGNKAQSTEVVNAARQSGADVESVKRCKHKKMNIHLCFAAEIHEFTRRRLECTDQAGSNKASAGPSSARKLEQETEDFHREL